MAEIGALNAAAKPAAAPPKPQSVRSYAPEGSRVTALLRVDRLRDTPYAALVDAMLMRLPDRRDLLEGTDLDLYRDVDALLVATEVRNLAGRSASATSGCALIQASSTLINGPSTPCRPPGSNTSPTPASSEAVRANQPTVSKLGANGQAPARLIAPWLGRMPNNPQ